MTQPKSSVLPKILVVIAILVVLVLLAKLGPLLGPGEPAVARVKADMRVIAISIEAYRADEWVYPLCTTETARQVQPFGSGTDLPTFLADVDNPLLPVWVARSPYYSSRLPKDPFSPRGKEHLAYWRAAGDAGWFMVSRGPDGDFDLDLEALSRVGGFDRGKPSRELLTGYTWDSSNGSKSSGDVWSVSYNP